MSNAAPMTASQRPPIPPEDAVSPRIQMLQAALKKGDTAAVDQFWDEVAAAGTPLLEAIAGEPDQRIVTFVWRDQGQATRTVLLAVNTLTDRHRHNNDLSPYLMQRVPGTDIWHKSIRLRSDFRAAYRFYPYDEQRTELEPTTSANRAAWVKLLNGALPDPFNAETVDSPRGDGAQMSIVALPDAPSQRWVKPRPGVAAGHVTHHQVPSAILANTHTVTLYLPPGYKADDTPYPLLLLFDGEVWSDSLSIMPMLDNLIDEGLIPSLIALLVHNDDLESRGRELPCSEAFVNFLTEELLPWASAQWRITSDPARTIVAGQSYGGLAATFAGYRAPTRFGNILSQSGSFWWKDFDLAGPDAEWLTQQFRAATFDANTHPLCWYMEVGLYEWMLLETNQRLRDVLLEKGYAVPFMEFNGGHDYVCWRGGLGDGLRTLTQGWNAAA